MFTEVIQLIVWAAGVVTLLLMTLIGVVAYFLKELHRDFKDMKNLVSELLRRLEVQEEKGKSGHRLLEHRLDEHEEDIRTLQKQIHDLETK